MLDIDRILRAQIPDIAPIYGGVRGRTMSSRHLSYAWPAIVEAGVKTIVDLRDKDSTDRLPAICSQYGLEYFHYPTDINLSRIDEMAYLLPKLCEIIDRGDFYIACAMGLHRTDIALCIYWMFYAADKHIVPPDIHGYLQEEGHDISKIMRVLNAFYKRMSEINGREPIPMQVFVERKQIIKQLSKEHTNT